MYILGNIPDVLVLIPALIAATWVAMLGLGALDNKYNEMITKRKIDLTNGD